MKHVDIEFVNIQSHEHTRFSLEPGLNFILAEDNNVGKSTIFKVLMCAMQWPKVDSVTPNELVRGGCSSAHATFTVDGTAYTFWLFREGTQSRAFFETRYSDGTISRSNEAPAGLRDAFDVVLGDDGQVLNFNDADSVQLIVQDTTKNDEVLARVLVDVNVETIKENSMKLASQVQQDYKLLQARHESAAYAVSTMHYCDAVDMFKSEYPSLESTSRVLDTIETPCVALRTIPAPPDMKSIGQVQSALTLCEELHEISRLEAKRVGSVKEEELNECAAAIKAHGVLSELVHNVPDRQIGTIGSELTEVSRALSVLFKLTDILAKMANAANAAARSVTNNKEIKELETELAASCVKVICPVKGEVLFTDEKCIPVGDGPTRGHGEGSQGKLPGRDSAGNAGHSQHRGEIQEPGVFCEPDIPW